MIRFRRGGEGRGSQDGINVLVKDIGDLTSVLLSQACVDTANNTRRIAPTANNTP